MKQLSDSPVSVEVLGQYQIQLSKMPQCCAVNVDYLNIILHYLLLGYLVFFSIVITDLINFIYRKTVITLWDTARVVPLEEYEVVLLGLSCSAIHRRSLNQRIEPVTLIQAIYYCCFLLQTIVYCVISSLGVAGNFETVRRRLWELCLNRGQ